MQNLLFGQAVLKFDCQGTQSSSPQMSVGKQFTWALVYQANKTKMLAQVPDIQMNILAPYNNNIHCKQCIFIGVAPICA